MTDYTKPYDGGSAFPNPYIEADPLEKGMTLRDWFAGQALANPRTHFIGGEATAEDIAIQAYAVADAMIEERNL